MQTLLTAIVAWLSVGFGLPAHHEHPTIEVVSAAQMDAVQRRAAGHGPAHRGSQREVEALYDDQRRTIYLRQGWSGETPAEISVLVHEMVHHLQNAAGLRYECPQAREKLAYDAQDRWLVQSGRNLIDEFQLDPLTVLLRTKCMH